MKKASRILLIIIVILIAVLGASYWFTTPIQFMTAHYHEHVAMGSEKHLEFERLFNEDLEASKAGDTGEQFAIESVLVVNESEDARSIRFHNPYRSVRGNKLDAGFGEVGNFVQNPPEYITYCAETEEEPQTVPLYFVQFNQLVFGGGLSRTALICDDQYIIAEFSATGQTYWGPFTK